MPFPFFFQGEGVREEDGLEGGKEEGGEEGGVLPYESVQRKGRGRGLAMDE